MKQLFYPKNNMLNQYDHADIINREFKIIFLFNLADYQPKFQLRFFHKSPNIPNFHTIFKFV